MSEATSAAAFRADSYLLVATAASTRGGLAEAWIAGLRRQERDREVQIIHNETGMLRCEQANGERLVASLQALRDRGLKSPLVVSAGGDGTLHYIGKRLLALDTPAEIAQTPITAWPFGYGSDGYASAHGPAASAHPLAIFHHPNGRIIQSHPLKWHMTREGGKEITDWSVLYGSAGLSAVCGAILHSQKHRRLRAALPRQAHRAVDFAHCLPRLLRPSHYDVSIMQDGAVHNDRIIEAQFVNGDRMAIYGKYGRSTHLEDPAMHALFLRHGNAAALGWTIFRLMSGNVPGQHTAETITITGRLSPLLPVQIDGEPLPPVLSASVGPTEKYLNIYVTKTLASGTLDV